MKKEKKKNVFFICINSTGLYIYFGIRATVKLPEKNGVLHIILVSEHKEYRATVLKTYFCICICI